MQSSSSNEDQAEEEEMTTEQKMAVAKFYEDLKRYQEDKGDTNHDHTDAGCSFDMCSCHDCRHFADSSTIPCPTRP